MASRRAAVLGRAPRAIAMTGTPSGSQAPPSAATRSGTRAAAAPPMAVPTRRDASTGSASRAASRRMTSAAHRTRTSTIRTTTRTSASASRTTAPSSGVPRARPATTTRPASRTARRRCGARSDRCVAVSAASIRAPRSSVRKAPCAIEGIACRHARAIPPAVPRGPSATSKRRSPRVSSPRASGFDAGPGLTAERGDVFRTVKASCVQSNASVASHRSMVAPAPSARTSATRTLARSAMCANGEPEPARSSRPSREV